LLSKIILLLDNFDYYKLITFILTIHFNYIKYNVIYKNHHLHD